MAVDLRVTPWNDYIVIEFADQPMSAGGIHLVAGTDPTSPKYGRVLAVGPGRVSEQGVMFAVPCAPGDLLLLNGSPGTDQKIDGRTVRFIRPGDVYGKVSE